MKNPVWYDTFSVVSNTVKDFNVSRIEDKDDALAMRGIFSDISIRALRSISEYAQEPSVKDLAFEVSIAASKLKNLATYDFEKLSFFQKREVKEILKAIDFAEAHLTDVAVSLRRYEGVFPGSEAEIDLLKRNKINV